MNGRASHSDANSVVNRLREFFDSGATRPLAYRVDALRRLEEALVDSREALLEALAEDLGKPVHEAYLTEFHFLLEEVRLLRRMLPKWLKPERAGNPFYFLPCRSRIERDPFGVALVLSTWNYPVQISLSPLIAAVAAGNTVALKPSEMAPASAGVLAGLARRCFDDAHVAVVTGGSDVAVSLLEERFDFVFFTGSTRVGRKVAAQAAAHLTPVALELGGKCPCVVDRTADLGIAAKRVLTGKLLNAGQTCFAPDFVAVHEAVREEFTGEITALLGRLPWESELSRMVNRAHYDRVLNLCSGEQFQKGTDDPAALRIAPRVLTRARWEDEAMRSEIFGPALPVVGFDSDHGLFGKLKALPKPLALYCFSKNPGFVETLSRQVASGSFCINDTMKQAVNLNLPFGGVGESGHGRYRGRRGVETFSYERAVTERYSIADPFELLPPFAEKFERLRRWLK